MNDPITLTLYKNLSYRQPLVITGKTQEDCLLKLCVWAINNNGERSRYEAKIVKGELVMVGRMYETDRAASCDGLCIMPPYPNSDSEASAVLSYCESYKNWELEYHPGEIDIFDTFGEALDQFIGECRLDDNCWEDESQ